MNIQACHKALQPIPWNLAGWESVPKAGAPLGTAESCTCVNRGPTETPG
jgi:hypothetical protein